MSRTIEILAVDDNEADRVLLEAEFIQCRVPHRLNFVHDGRGAIDYVLKQGPHENARTPDLVLLDLNLPGIDGKEVLAQMKAHPKLRSIPVVVLSTSNNPREIAEAYASGASGFVCKPPDLDSYIRTIQALQAYWLGVVLYPR